jgi:mono/diheme cytochrome c family protein
MRTARNVITALVVAATAGLAGAALAQTATPHSLVSPSMAGRDLFTRYCAACHGTDAKGRGSAAQNLATPPADLTAIAHRRNGTFPRDEIRAIVTGNRALIPAHISNDMPVWGDIFQGLDANERVNRVRINNLVDYLASIQAR